MKSVIVTGASRGIGASVAKKFAALSPDHHYQVIATATSAKGTDKINDYLSSCPIADQNYPHMAMELDISCAESIAAFYERLAELHINPAILVNNAGITRDNLALRIKQEEWDQVIHTNLTGSFMMAKKALKTMLKARWGRIINISSVVASRGNPGQVNYVASKAGVEGFSRVLALETANRNITVNSVAPGFIVTDMTDKLNQQQKETLLEHIPLRRFGSTEDIAAAVAFLASEQAGYITGITLPVNGGMHIHA